MDSLDNELEANSKARSETPSSRNPQRAFDCGTRHGQWRDDRRSSTLPQRLGASSQKLKDQGCRGTR